MKFTKPRYMMHSEFKFNVDGVEYIAHTFNRHLNQGYARCVIEDTSTNHRYYVHNREEINGHVFYVLWNEEYSYYRDNYVPGEFFTIYVDEVPDIDVQSVTNPLICKGECVPINQNISLTIS